MHPQTGFLAAAGQLTRVNCSILPDPKPQFSSHEHGTSGTAKIINLPDGSRVLRIEDLDTSNGPDLKGNKGSQSYRIPADAILSKLASVSIWCDRFSVSIGAPQLKQ